MKKITCLLLSVLLVFSMVSFAIAGSIPVVTEPTAEDMPEPASVQDVVDLELGDFADEFLYQDSAVGILSGDLVNVTPGEKRNISISLQTDAPDKKYSDGDFQYQFANWIMLNENKRIVANGQYLEINGSYEKVITVTASNSGNFVIIPYIINHNILYNQTEEVWHQDGYEVAEKEGALMSVLKGTIQNPTDYMKIIIGSIIGLVIILILIVVVLFVKKK